MNIIFTPLPKRKRKNNNEKKIRRKIEKRRK
jgi:hypothetical protein